MEGIRLFPAVLLSLIAIRTSHTASIGSQNGIRLSYGYTQNEGLVEVLVKETLLKKNSGLVWGTVCSSGHPNQAIGEVICRQLGYEAWARFKDTRNYVLPNHDRVALEVTNCQGTEFKLEECEIKKFPKSCNHGKLAVVCAKSGSVRFESDRSPVTHSGVVEAYINPGWEDVCTEQTVTRDRLCRQLGFTHSKKQGEPIFRNNQHFAVPNWENGSVFCNSTAFSTEGCVSYDRQEVKGMEGCGNSDLNVTCVGPIGKVGLPRVDHITATTARVHWSIPDSRNVQYYHFIVAYWEAGGNRNNRQEVEFERVTYDFKVLSNLKSNTEYFVEVVASGGIQAGEFSEPVMFKTKIARPNPPSGLTIHSNNGREVVLTHQGQSLPNGSRLEVQYQSVERRRQCVSYKTVPYGRNVTLDDLRPNTNYSAKMRVIQQVDGLDIYSTFSDETVTFAVDKDETVEKPVLSVDVNDNIVKLSLRERTRRQIGTISDTTAPTATPTTSRTDDVIILGITCVLDPIGERRQYYWEDPYTSDLILGDLPHNIKGSCSARLHTSYGSSESSDFEFNTSEARITHPPELLSPEVTAAGKVRISWVIPQGYQPFGNITESIVKIWKLGQPNSNFTKHVNTTEYVESLSPGVEMYFSVALKNKHGSGPFSAPQIARAPHIRVPGVPSSVLSVAHHADASMSRLSLLWSFVDDSEGYVVVATAYNEAGNHVTVTNTVLSFDFTTHVVSTNLSFQISCASHFIFQVAAFNSRGQGNFSQLEEMTTSSTDCVTTTTIASTDDSELYLYILIGLLMVTVILLVVGGIVIVCLMHHYCMLLKDKKEKLPDDIIRRGSQSTIRSSVRYIGVGSRKLNAETKPDYHKSEDELTSRPLPIPTESDLEEEEEEEEMKIEALRRSVSPPPLPPPVMDLDGGYSTIPNDVRNDIVKGSNNNILMSSSMSQGLLEQGYEFVQSTSTSQLGSQNKDLNSPTAVADPTYNIPRSSRHGSHTPVEYEVPVSSRSNTPNMSTLGKPQGTFNQGMKSASAPHALTYDVPPSRNRVLVTGGNVQRSPSPMGTYDVPKNVSGGRLTPSFMTPDNTYDMPRNVSGGFQPPVIVTTPPPGENPPNGVPYIKTPDSLYDVPTSSSAVNEYGYDVLPGRSPIGSGRVSPTNPSSSSVRTSTPPIPPREQDNENMYDNLSPVPMNGNLYDTPRSVLASEENLVVSAVGDTKENTETDPKVPVQNDLYDTPRKVLSGEDPVISNDDKNDDDDVDEVFNVDDAALEWKEGVNWELPDPPDDEISTSEGVNDSNTPSSQEQSPKQKVENPYSRVKRMTGEDGVRTKVTVVDDEPQVVEDPTSIDRN